MLKTAFCCIIPCAIVTILAIVLIPAIAISVTRFHERPSVFAGPDGSARIRQSEAIEKVIDSQPASDIGLADPTDPKSRAQAVTDAFKFAWNGYYTHAFPHDELLPLDNKAGDSRNGWGASAVDALSTAIVMQLPDVVDEILTHISKIDWSHSPEPVSVFETNIRYLGGMLSGFDLLSGPFNNLARNGTLRLQLLSQSQRLADLLAVAFQTPVGIPDNVLSFNGSAKRVGSQKNCIANIGTLQLEWARLSRLTGNATYSQLSQAPMKYLLQPRSANTRVINAEPFPGLIGQNIRISDGAVVDQKGGWGPESDSFYEYLLKMYVYDPNSFGHYKDRWVQAVDSTMTYLASRPYAKENLTFVAHYDGTKLLPEAWHLDCFAGGNILLGGSILNNSKYIDFGLEIINGCRASYASTATRIGPELFRWLPSECINPTNGTVRAEFKTTSGASKLTPATVDCSARPRDRNATKYYRTNGMWIADGTYNLRPEVLESYYYAYRITGDKKYQDWAWEAFTAFNTYCKLQNGFNVLNDVNVEGGQPRVKNYQESYFFAETMMYAYLIFADDGPWHVNYKGGNQFVFNTEGHPIHIAAA